MKAIAAGWQRRSSGERRIAAFLGALAALLLLAALVWLPLERSRASLAQDVPRLAAELATMQRQAAEVQAVRAMPAATPATAAPLSGLVASGALQRNLPGAQVTVADERRVRLVAADAAYGALLEALAAALATHGLRVESARLEALPAPGRVRADLVLTRA